jgi:hypothetical protein
MIDPFILIDGMRKAMNDPNRSVLIEVEKRRPGWRRDHILAVTVLFLASAIMLFALLMGWQLPF